MPTDRDLAASVERIDGQGYRSYKQIKGRYDFGDFVLVIDHVQGDPFAQPSRLRAIVPQTTAKIPPKYFSSFSREVGLRDFLTRQFSSAVTATPARRRGSGKSGLIVIDRPPQEILERTSVMVDNREVEARFLVGLPADGRRILGNDA
ncbi:MAG: ABC-ATPase domain-containing protein, partial [Candidatus Latescibacteria bacterium]|nr:ABC-ATPase domain-containing protein [Candidatus Latescibacterota bacterium]